MYWPSTGLTRAITRTVRNIVCDQFVMSLFRNGPSFFSCNLRVILKHLKWETFRNGGTRCTESSKLSVRLYGWWFQRTIFTQSRIACANGKILHTQRSIDWNDETSQREVVVGRIWRELWFTNSIMLGCSHYPYSISPNVASYTIMVVLSLYDVADGTFRCYEQSNAIENFHRLHLMGSEDCLQHAVCSFPPIGSRTPLLSLLSLLLLRV